MLDLLTASPKEIAFGEKRYQVGALKMRELGQLQRWIRDHAERPTKRAERECDFLPPEEHRELKKAAVLAERHWPPAIGTGEGNRLLLTDEDGQRYFLEVMLGKYQAVSAEELDELLAGMSEGDFATLVAIAFGEDDLDPEQARARAQERLQEVADALARLMAMAAEAPAPTGESSSST